jgi:branched-chain amino acid transport system permease protein
MELFGVSLPALFDQLLVGAINGAFYAMLSLGLAIIFGLLNVINFAHGALYMMGAFAAWLLFHYLGVGYWGALILAPILVGLFGIVIEQLFIRHTYKLNHLFGFLLTFGLVLIIEGGFRQIFGAAGLPYAIPPDLRGAQNLGFMLLPNYRAWVIVAALISCLATWAIIEKTRLGSYLRAATENPTLVQAFGVNVPLLVTLTYGCGVALAALGGVLAAPIYQVNPMMGSNLIAVVFAVVVIGGMGSILGSILSGFALGIIEGLTKTFYPEASATIIFVIMAIVLLLKPAGLFGRPQTAPVQTAEGSRQPVTPLSKRALRMFAAVALALAIAAPFIGLYPIFLMKALCFALFACAFNLLLGYTGLLSFGHAAFFGMASYTTAYSVKAWGLPPEAGILLGTAIAAMLGLLFGYLAIRRQGIYFAMITLALSQIVYFFCVQVEFTGGEDGIQSVPRGMLFGFVDLEDTTNMYLFVLACFVVGFAIVYRTIHSPFGNVLKAIRENEQRAISLGYKVDRYKLLAFVISAALAGFAGSVKCLVFQLASLTDVHWIMSGEVVLMTLVGGMGTVFGPVVGAFVLVTLEQYLAGTGSWVPVIQGCVFVLCVLVFRRGIIGEVNRFLRKVLPRLKPR